LSSLREVWDAQAESWARFARTPGHDVAHERINFPAFLELLPRAGRATLDLGCGEGRVGAELVARGHRVVGVDSSPRMAELARERHEAIVADAAALPFEDGAFDLVVAYMSLMNMDDLAGAVHEAGRVLERGGRLCAAVLHPLFAAGGWEDPNAADSAFVIAGSYFEGPTKVWESDRDGIRMVFHDRPAPLAAYTRALEDAGLLLERLREVSPAETVADAPPAERLRRIPLFLHLRAVKP
jgi:SAM-dependent methyltransferase